MENNGKKVRKD